MARRARVVVPGLPHHIVQIGNGGMTLFRNDLDYASYLLSLQRYSSRYGVEVLAYCLMPDHVHLVVVPTEAHSLARAFRDTHTVFALRLNKQEETRGHVWQGRYASTVLDEDHLWAAIRYIERNPLRAGLTTDPLNYPWSSAAAHAGLRCDLILSRTFDPTTSVNNWGDWLDVENPAAETRIRTLTRVGRPCGSRAFVEDLSEQLGRPLLPQKPGRKPKPKRRYRKRSGSADILSASS